MTCAATFTIAAAGAAPNAYWKFETVSGGAYLDTIASIPFSITSGTAVNTGIIGNGVEITKAVRSTIDTHTQTGLGSPAVNGFSISFWFKTLSAGVNPNVVKMLFNFSDLTLVENQIKFNGNLDLSTTPTNGNTLDVTPTATTGVWHFVVQTFNQTNNVATTYLDNVSVGSANLLGGCLHSANAEFSIDNQLGGNVSPDVVFDELGYWANHVLSTTEINSMWNGGAGARPPGV